MAPAEGTRWEGLDAGEMARFLAVPEAHLFESTTSTNDVARRLAAAGAPAATMVLAEEQTAGRGRAGRAWSSRPGLGIWLSMVARPATLAAPGRLPLLVGVTVARALQPFAAPADVRVKWPNDLQVAGRKLAGILCESAWEGARPSYVVVGVGINVAHAPDDFPPELRAQATSLRIAAGRAPRRLEVLGAVVRELGPLLASDDVDGADPLPELRARDALFGRPVRVVEPETGREICRGRAAGVDAAGSLLVVTADGTVRDVASGTVTTIPSPAEA